MKNQNKYTVITVHELLFLISFSVLFIMKGIGIYEGMLAFNISIVVSFLCAGFAMLMADYTIAEFIGAIVLLGCSFLAYFETGEKAVIAAVLMVIGMKNVSLERMMKLAFVLWTVCFYGMVFVHLVGWREDIILAHNKFGLGYILRRSLGYPHPNVLHISFIIWMALFLYVWEGKKILKATIILSIANIVMFFYTVSVTGMGLGFIYLFCNYYFSVRKKINKLEKGLIKAVLPLCIFSCTVPPIVLDGKIEDLLNKILNTRLYIWKCYLTTYVPGIFGTRVYREGETIMSLDCSYLYLLYFYGWFLFMVFMGLTFWTICRCLKKGNKKELAIIIGLSIAGIVEPFLYNFSVKNIILFFIGYELFDALKNNQGKKINILPWGKKEIKFYKFNISMENVIKSWDIIKRKCLVIGIIIGILSSIYTAFSFKSPEQIYVPRNRCDYLDNEGILRNEIENQNECWILGDNKPETRFVGFEGNMIVIEYIRIVIVNGFIGVAVGIGTIWGINTIRLRKKN